MKCSAWSFPLHPFKIEISWPSVLDKDENSLICLLVLDAGSSEESQMPPQPSKKAQSEKAVGENKARWQATLES